jgi:Mg2+-importing ATPase
LLISSLAVVAAGIIIPLTALGGFFKFIPLPSTFYIFLVAFIGTYLVLAEVLKRYFYKRYSYRLEQTVFPRKAYHSRPSQ